MRNHLLMIGLILSKIGESIYCEDGLFPIVSENALVTLPILKHLMYQELKRSAALPAFVYLRVNF